MFMPRKLGTGWNQSTAPVSGSSPLRRSRVCTTSCRRPARVARIGEEKAPLRMMLPSFASARQTVSPVRLSSLTIELAAWT